MRHQIRDNDISFCSSLNKDGKFLAINDSKPKLNKLNITQIYSSPFLRTLQTIEPYVKGNGKLVNVEYSLYEYLNKSFFSKDNYLQAPDKSWYNAFNINKRYKSFLNPLYLKYGETEYDIQKRVNNFLRYLLKKYEKTNEVILLVTHMHTAQCIIKAVKMPNIEINMGDIIRII